MGSSSSAELVVRARDIHELFGEREFDPVEDDTDAVWSIAQIAKLSEAAGDRKAPTLRILLPPNQVSPQGQALVRLALARYCSRKIAEADVEMIAWRRVAWGAFFRALTLFAGTLVLTALLQRVVFLPSDIRTLGTEGLIIAGWVIIWQPMERLLLGWWPIRVQKRRFQAIRAMHTIVEPALPPLNQEKAGATT